MRLRVQYNAPVVLTFAFLALAALVAGNLTGGWTTTRFFSVYRASFTDPLTYFRLVGHVLGHANYSHYMGNMMLLLVVGPPLEERYGSARLLGCMFITALTSGLVQFFLFPGTALLGASGIVFMMPAIALGLWFLGGREGHRQALFMTLAVMISLGLVLVAVFYLGGEWLDAVTVQDNVSHLTHILGGLCGAILGFDMRK